MVSSHLEVQLLNGTFHLFCHLTNFFLLDHQLIWDGVRRWRKTDENSSKVGVGGGAGEESCSERKRETARR